jgi:hypothetical protein
MTIAPSSQDVFPVENGSRILHLHYPTRYALCASFMRLQEFYESDIPGIQGRFFTLEEFMDAYAWRMGNFTYTEDWGGFNVPGTVWKRWRECFPASTLLEKEKTLVATVEAMLGQDGNATDFYLIGSCAETSDLREVVSHELAHALFALSPRYREIQTDLVKCWKQDAPGDWESIAAKLLEMGYVGTVLVDEVQAYFSTSDDEDLKRLFGFGTCPDRSRFVTTFLETVEANAIALPPYNAKP